MPATPYNGRVLTEDNLRAFGHCPRYFSFGGNAPIPGSIALLKLTTEKVISNAVRSDKLDPMNRHMKCLLQASKELKLKDTFLESQVKEMEAHVGIALGEVFNAFSAHKFLPVFGPAPWKVKISKSVIQLETSGILRSSDKTLHFIEFSPFQTIHGFRNDPILHLKIDSVRGFCSTIFKEKKIVIHAFGLNEKYKLLYNKVETATTSQIPLQRIERQIKAMEIGYDSPVLPCAFQCPFKHQCFLETE